jgi:hypothetical protein
MRNLIKLRCGNELTKVLVLVVAALCIVSPVASWSQSQPTINDLFRAVNARIPAFGGMYVDPDKDTWYVQIVRGYSATTADVSQAVGDILGPDRPPESALVLVDAQYSFVQLQDWQNQADPLVLQVPGVVSTFIHHSTNRLRIGVENNQVQAAVRTQLVRLGIPLEAVEIVQESPPQEWSNRECTSVQDFCRPIVGGLQIDADARGKISSLGFIATRKDVQGLVTCSHCANVPFKNTGTMYGQPNQDHLVGKETANPPLTKTLGADKTCPENSICRLSDSSFAEFVGDGPESKQGFIARPALNQTNWNGNDYFRIIDYKKSLEGQNVAKVGRTTGRTEGKVLGICGNIKLGIAADATAQPMLVCVNAAGFKGGPGDSGGPVFLCTDTEKPCSDATKFDVNLLGVLHGGNDTSAIYSDIGLIMDSTSELGPLKQFCAREVKNPSCS